MRTRFLSLVSCVFMNLSYEWSPLVQETICSSPLICPSESIQTCLHDQYLIAFLIMSVHLWSFFPQGLPFVSFCKPYLSIASMTASPLFNKDIAMEQLKKKKKSKRTRCTVINHRGIKWWLGVQFPSLLLHHDQWNGGIKTLLQFNLCNETFSEVLSQSILLKNHTWNNFNRKAGDSVFP